MSVGLSRLTEQMRASLKFDSEQAPSVGSSSPVMNRYSCLSSFGSVSEPTEFEKVPNRVSPTC